MHWIQAGGTCSKWNCSESRVDSVRTQEAEQLNRCIKKGFGILGKFRMPKPFVLIDSGKLHNRVECVPTDYRAALDKIGHSNPAETYCACREFFLLRNEVSHVDGTYSKQ